MLLAITGQRALLDQNPLLARSINKNRFPYLDPLNHVQIELSVTGPAIPTSAWCRQST
jgi:phosphoenolpyruvate carboxylase